MNFDLRRLSVVGVMVLLLCPALVMAQTPDSQLPIDSGATAWMLTSTALVLLMVPGLAMFYGGLCAPKTYWER